jgi:anti-sigma28 factor (negative regulator of flagellin synthesis)
MKKAMKISSQQVKAALAAYVDGKAKHTERTAGERAVGEGEARDPELEQHLANLPEERDTIVHQLRRKIRRGRYFVSSRDIVNALLGRLTADLLNEE